MPNQLSHAGQGSSDFLSLDVLVAMKGYLIVGLSCIFLMTNDVEHLFFFFKLYFTDYKITVIPIFPHLLPSTLQPPSLRQSLHHCSRPRVMSISALATPFPALYFTSPWLFCNHLFVLLNPLTSSPTPHHEHLFPCHLYTFPGEMSLSFAHF